jgi:hypothetical protein
MMKRFTYAAMELAFLAMMFVFGSCHSRRSIGIEQGWDLLSDRKVNFVRDKDEIIVHNGTEYTALRFRVERRDIHLDNLKIYFQNGDKLEPNLDEDIKAGEYSRVIELGREGRNIDRIEFKYRTVGNVLKGRADVLVLARKHYRSY